MHRRLKTQAERFVLGHLEQRSADPYAHQESAVQEGEARLPGDRRIEQKQSSEACFGEHRNPDDVRSALHVLGLIVAEVRLVNIAFERVVDVLNEPNHTDHNAGRHQMQLQNQPVPSAWDETF